LDPLLLALPLLLLSLELCLHLLDPLLLPQVLLVLLGKLGTSLIIVKQLIVPLNIDVPDEVL
jgi:hypothetical protein